jgi:NitT/TauT family transport system permease protein
MSAIGADVGLSERRKTRSAVYQLKLWVPRLLVLAVGLGVWQYLAWSGLVADFWISRPTKVFGRLYEDLGGSVFWTHLKVTMQEIAVGLILGGSTGVAAGLIFGYLEKVYEVLEPIIMGLYTLPRIALAPLFIIWFGIGLTSKIALVVSLVFFLMLLNTYQGVKNVDRDLIDSVRTMGASRRFLARRVILPSSVPWIMAGFRLSAVYGISGAVVGEMLIARHGLGVMLTTSANNFDTTGVFAVLVILGVLGFTFNIGVASLERLLLKWRR